MLIIVLKVVFIVSVLGILFIVLRKMPALSRLPKESLVEKFSFGALFDWFRRIKKQFFLSYFFQTIIIGNLEKSLRKLKILALKIDNILDKFLRKFKKNKPM